MKNLLINLIVALFLAACNTSQENKLNNEALSGIDEVINNEINNNNIPGAVVLVGNHKEIIFQNAYGIKNPETNESFKKNDIFRIASMTKAITSFAILKLWEKGKIGLDDPVHKYIPQFASVEILDSFNENDSSFTTKKRINDITIRHLLTHTSGIGYDFIDGNPYIKAIYHKKKQSFMKYGVLCFCDQDVTIGESIEKLSGVPLHHQPGEKYTYGIGLDVLGYVIEIVSGKPLDVFFKEEIFDPLEMNDTYFYIPKEKENRLVPVLTFNSGLSYNNNLQNDKKGEWSIFEDERFNVNYPIEGEKKFFAGGCGLSSTVQDYYNFLSLFINDGRFKENQIISKSTNDMIFKNQLSDDFNNSIGLVFGITRNEDSWFDKKGRAGVLHWGGYWNTNFFADPHNKIIGLIYKQTQNTNEDSWGKFRDVIYSSIDN